jgi:eukaryotic-like serine/threonine-protein kinase
MDPERWQLIEQLYHAALERGRDERASFIARACSDDGALRREVEALLAANEQAGGFMAAPALEVEAKNLAAQTPALQLALEIGQDLSHYKIISRIGAGGMGEVFLAQDKILERPVALKLLPAQFTQNRERLHRFIREAKTASALNHPNIITIYEIGEVVTNQGKTHFIATEFIEGETLRTLAVDEEKRLSQTLNIVIQIASALAAAHKAGIVHRDIKPENVMVRPDGLVKVLDFGLAKLTLRQMSGPGTGGPDTKAETITEGVKTQPGMILGTLRYMSPEQARGREVDARSDIFSLGVVLYEMLTGERLFAGETDADVVAGIIHKQAPPLGEHLPEVAGELERIVQKALAKEADARYQSTEEMLDALRAVPAHLPATNSLPTSKTATSRGRVVTALLGVLKRPRVFTSVSVVIVVAGLVSLSALFWLRAAPHKPSSEAMRWYDEGTRSLRNSAYYEASKRLERSVQIDDKFALAHARLAEAWAELDYSDKANNEILRARSLVGDLSALPRLERLYLRAITHVVLREFAPAIENYQQITQEAPEAEKAQAYLDLGRAYDKNDEIDKAIENYLEARNRAPSDGAAFLRLGMLYGRQQNLDSAQEAFKEAEDIYQDLSNDEGVTEVLYQRGRLLISLDRFAEARGQLEKALKITSATANQYQQVKAMLALSNVFASEGRASEAEKQAKQAIELAQSSGIENQATGGLIWLGMSISWRGGHNDAERYYKQALELARRNNGRENEAWALLQLGSLRSLQHNTEEALSYIEQALTFYRQGGYRKTLWLALTLKGRVYRDKGDYEAALQAFNEVLELGREAGDRSQMALSHEGIGNVLVRQERYPEALLHFDENYKINRSLNAKASMGFPGINRATVLWQIGGYEKARAALDEVLSIAQRPEGSNKLLLAHAYMIEGGLELSLRNFPESKKNSQQALNLADTQYRDIAVQAKYTLGLAQARSGAARAGQLLCKEAVDLATPMGDPQLLSIALLALAEATLEGGDSQRALETALQAREIFASFGRQESEWRAWLIAALSSRRPGEEATARKYASTAETLLSSLEQKWGPEAYNGYQARPDIQHARGQLGRVLKP